MIGTMEFTRMAQQTLAQHCCVVGPCNNERMEREKDQLPISPRTDITKQVM